MCRWGSWLRQICALSFGWCASVAAFASPPAHILSLDLCSDWLLAYYAHADQSVTLSPLVQRHPLPVAVIPRPSHDGSLEHVVALKPDVVLVGEFNAFMLRKRLESLGVRVFSTPLPQTLDDLVVLDRSIQTLLGHSPVMDSFKPRKLTSLAKPHGRLLLLGPNGYGVGRNTLEDNLITQAGWVNYTEHAGHVRLDLEAVVSNPPDAIVWSAPRYAALAHTFAQHPVLKRAVPPQRWIQTDDWRWQCPGPWMYQLIEQLQP